jgi:hypothetical protein
MAAMLKLRQKSLDLRTLPCTIDTGKTKECEFVRLHFLNKELCQRAVRID